MHYHHGEELALSMCRWLSLEEMQKGCQRKGAGYQGVPQPEIINKYY